ncbi:MAG: hypothetical protein ACLSB9_24495 [Hydrogeniiclostridium mannosilyticum]
MKQNILLSHLLDKYEKSKHLTQPGTSTRRVMLRIENTNFRSMLMKMHKFETHGTM